MHDVSERPLRDHGIEDTFRAIYLRLGDVVRRKAEKESILKKGSSMCPRWQTLLDNATAACDALDHDDQLRLQMAALLEVVTKRMQGEGSALPPPAGLDRGLFLNKLAPSSRRRLPRQAACDAMDALLEAVPPISYSQSPPRPRIHVWSPCSSHCRPAELLTAEAAAAEAAAAEAAAAEAAAEVAAEAEAEAEEKRKDLPSQQRAVPLPAAAVEATDAKEATAASGGDPTTQKRLRANCGEEAATETGQIVDVAIGNVPQRVLDFVSRDGMEGDHDQLVRLKDGEHLGGKVPEPSSVIVFELRHPTAQWPLGVLWAAVEKTPRTNSALRMVRIIRIVKERNARGKTKGVNQRLFHALVKKMTDGGKVGAAFTLIDQACARSRGPMWKWLFERASKDWNVRTGGTSSAYSFNLDSRTLDIEGHLPFLELKVAGVSGRRSSPPVVAAGMDGGAAGTDGDAQGDAVKPSATAESIGNALRAHPRLSVLCREAMMPEWRTSRFRKTTFMSIIQAVTQSPHAVMAAYLGEQGEHVARLLLHTTPPLHSSGDALKAVIVISHVAIEVDEEREGLGYGHALVAAAQSCIQTVFQIPVIEIVNSSSEALKFWQSSPMYGHASPQMQKLAAKVGAVVGPLEAFTSLPGCSWLQLRRGQTAKERRQLIRLGLEAEEAEATGEKEVTGEKVAEKDAGAGEEEEEGEEAVAGEEATGAEAAAEEAAGSEAVAAGVGVGAEFQELKLKFEDGSTKTFPAGYKTTLPIKWSATVPIGAPVACVPPLPYELAAPPLVPESAPLPCAADGAMRTVNWLQLIMDGKKTVELRGFKPPKAHMEKDLLLIASEGYPANQTGVRFVTGVSAIRYIDGKVALKLDKDSFEELRDLHRWPGTFKSAVIAARALPVLEHLPGCERHPSCPACPPLPAQIQARLYRPLLPIWSSSRGSSAL